MNRLNQQEPLDPRLWLVKIGGCIISTRENKDRLNEETIRLIARSLKSLANPLIIIHGTGHISKSFASHNQILNRTINARDKQKVCDCLLMLRDIHFTVLKIFVNEGINAVSISPFTFCKNCTGNIEIMHSQLLRTLLQGGYVPLIHGDLILDKKGDFRVCSSDDLAASVIMQFPVEKLLFATDVPGVYPEDPAKSSNNKYFNFLDANMLEKLAQLPDDENDVSGGMPAKLKAIGRVTNYFHECCIFDGRSPDAWQNLILLKKQAGTLIMGNSGNIPGKRN